MTRERKNALVVLALVLLAGPPAAGWRRGKGRGKRGTPATPGSFDDVSCKRCMTTVMRLLTPAARGCAAGNGTVVPSSTPARVPTAFCDTLLPKKRLPVVYSFGVDNIWDFDKTMAVHGCAVVSFDPFCCGGARKLSETQDFVPIGLAAYDGMATSDDPRRPNITYPVLTLRSIMEGFGHSKVCVDGRLAAQFQLAPSAPTLARSQPAPAACPHRVPRVPLARFARARARHARTGRRAANEGWQQL
eukprot:1942692-Prymnesium_polylepis.1